MSRATLGQVFSVPFRHLRSTNFSGDQTVSQGRPNGITRFVGDDKNEMLKFLVNVGKNLNQADDSHAAAVLQWPLVLSLIHI